MSARAWTSSDVSWRGGTAPYDLVKEGAIAVAVVAILAVLLTLLFSSPDPRPVTLQAWSKAAPADFVTTAATELAGTSGTAGYGPPYNSAAEGQHLGFVKPAKWIGVQVPIDTARDFVLAPLRTLPNPAVQAAVSRYESASPKDRAAWNAAYAKAAAKARVVGNAVLVRPGGAVPVPVLISALYGMAASTARCSRRGSSTRSTTPGACSSWATAPTSATRPPGRTSRATSGAS